MPRHCAAYGCSNNAYKLSCKERYISYHRFPLNDAELLKRWLIQIQRQDFTPSKYSFLCSQHFNEDDFKYQPFTNRREIKKHAVPSIFAHKPSVKRKRTSRQIGASVAINTVSEPEPATEDACHLVLGCVSGFNKTSKENEIAGQRTVPLFIPSKDDQLFEKQKRIIPRNDIFLSSKDGICRLHFEKGCNAKDYIIKLPDGTIHKIPRNHALKESSAPTVFPNEPSYLPVQTNERRAGTGFSENELRKLDGEESAELDNLQQSNDFFKLTAEIKNISTPNPLWSVVNTEDCIIFAKWNSKYFYERRVVICKDLSTKIFLMNTEVSLSDEECMTGNISKLLQKVDEFIICKNADSGTSGCLGFVADKRQELCFTCCISVKVENDAQRRIAQILVDNKKTKSVCQVKNNNKRNTCPKKMVLDLNHEVIESKHQSSQSKEAFLAAISHLPTEQQTAITSCQSFKNWFL